MPVDKALFALLVTPGPRQLNLTDAQRVMKDYRATVGKHSIELLSLARVLEVLSSADQDPRLVLWFDGASSDS